MNRFYTDPEAVPGWTVNEIRQGMGSLPYFVGAYPERGIKESDWVIHLGLRPFHASTGGKCIAPSYGASTNAETHERWDREAVQRMWPSGLVLRLTVDEFRKLKDKA